MGLTPVAAYVAVNGPPPGQPAHVLLDVREVLPDTVRAPGLTVADVRGGPLLSDDERLRSDPGRGGGPLSEPALDAGARAFALTNVAWWARRLLGWAEGELGRTLPPLRILVGSHQPGTRRWGGGHYRLPAASYSELPEDSVVDLSPQVTARADDRRTSI